MEKDYLILKRAAVSRPSGQWSDDDFDVLANGEVVGRIYKANAAPVGSPSMWTLVSGTTKVAARRTGVCCDPRGRHGGVRQKLAGTRHALIIKLMKIMVSF
jgi:hypothetical protein